MCRIASGCASCTAAVVEGEQREVSSNVFAFDTTENKIGNRGSKEVADFGGLGRFSALSSRVFGRFLDFLNALVILWAAHRFTGEVPISDSGAALFLLGVHETAVILAYVALAELTLWDTVQLKLKRKSGR